MNEDDEDIEDVEDDVEEEEEEEEDEEEEEEDSEEEEEEDSEEEEEEEEEDSDDDLNDDLNDGTRGRRWRRGGHGINVPGTERRHRHPAEDEEDEDEDESEVDDEEDDETVGNNNRRGGGGANNEANGTREEDGANDVRTNEDQQPAGRDDTNDDEARQQQQHQQQQQQQHDATNNQEGDERADTFHDKAYAAKRNVREIGDEAVWSVTSSKPGNGVELLRDGNLKTYWQSDGAQPHFINCQFQKKTNVCEVSIYTNYKQDESYTPSKIVIRAGNSYRDLKDVATKTLNEPHGWQRVRTTRLDKEKLKEIHAQYGSKKHLKNSGLEYLEKESCEAPIRAFFIQICIVQNHQNGRDTHVRQVHVYSPAATPASDGPRARFQSSEYARYAVVR